MPCAAVVENGLPNAWLEREVPHKKKNSSHTYEQFFLFPFNSFCCSIRPFTRFIWMRTLLVSAAKHQYRKQNSKTNALTTARSRYCWRIVQRSQKLSKLRMYSDNGFEERSEIFARNQNASTQHSMAHFIVLRFLRIGTLQCMDSMAKAYYLLSQCIWMYHVFKTHTKWLSRKKDLPTLQIICEYSRSRAYRIPEYVVQTTIYIWTHALCHKYNNGHNNDNKRHVRGSLNVNKQSHHRRRLEVYWTQTSRNIFFFWNPPPIN